MIVNNVFLVSVPINMSVAAQQSALCSYAAFPDPAVSRTPVFAAAASSVKRSRWRQTHAR